MSQDFAALVGRQRAFFATGWTKDVKFRLEALKKLHAAILRHEDALCRAMEADFHKPAFEVYMTEIGIVLEEISYMRRHLRRWARKTWVPAPLAQFPSVGYISPEPYGVSLILSPWNYPIQLCLAPLAAAIAAGNCAVVKPSAYTPNTSHALAALLAEVFPAEFVSVIEGGRAENQALLEQKFDFIFFTGSPAVGKLVMEAAAKHLTPVVLELGGKSPVIVDETADIRTAARRIAFGKVLNAGQTCVAPDYAFVHESVMEPFLEAFRQALMEFFPGQDMTGMPVIVNDKHFARVRGLMAGCEIAAGGVCDEGRRFIAPTLLTGVTPDSPVMQEEIFGPLLPVMAYRDLQTCIDYIAAHEKPLALYLFTTSPKTEKRVLDGCSFGGGCVNDTIVHLASPRLPFGGVGASGMGSYHGRQSFETFTHRRSVLKKANWLDLDIRYRPYSDEKAKMLRFFLK